MRSSLIRNCVWGIGTFGLALAMGLPAVSNAVDDSNSPGAAHSIRISSLTVNGVELSVSTAEPATQPSDKADPAAGRVLRLVVHTLNRTSAEASTKFTIVLDSVQSLNPASRVSPTPTQIWSESGYVVLNGGEAKTVEFAPPPLPNGKMLMVSLESDRLIVPAMALAPNSNGQLAQVP
jgi:hypothetical protein